MDRSSPSLFTKLLFWLLLGSLSVFFAEVASFSSPFPFFDIWGILVVLPLYTLHCLVLGAVIFRRKRVSLPILFIAGAIFGMYEAYITKVLWAPTWGDWTLTFGGLYVIQTIILVLYWHPFMAFILPLWAAEGLFTASRETLNLLPGFLKAPGRRTWIVAGLAALCGMVQGVNSPGAGVSLLSAAAAFAPIIVFARLWQAFTRGERHTLRSLLPRGRETLILGLLLLGGYVVQGIWGRPEGLPASLTGHITVWIIYLVLFGLLWLNLRGEPDDVEITLNEMAIPWRLVLIFGLVFALASAGFTLIKEIGALGVILSWLLGISLGLWLLVQAVSAALQGKKN